MSAEGGSGPRATSEGQKFDAGKPHARVFTSRSSLDLVPPECVEGVAEILEYGALKYDRRNWEKGMNWMRVYEAALRHLKTWAEGQDVDPESGLRHIDHAACNLAFLQAFTRRGVGSDDRANARS